MHSCKDVNMEWRGNWNAYFLNAVIIFRVISIREENLFHSSSVSLQLGKKYKKKTTPKKEKTNKNKQTRKSQKKNNNQTKKLLVRT